MVEAARNLAPTVSSVGPGASSPPASGSSFHGAESSRVRFADLDSELANAFASPSPVLRISAPASALDAVGAYARRKLASNGDIVYASSASVDAPWREAARAAGGRCGSPAEIAETLLAVASTRGVVVVERALSSFGRAVLEVLRSASQDVSESRPLAAPIVIVTCSLPPIGGAAFDRIGSETERWFVLDDALDAADVDAWWESLIRAKDMAPTCATFGELEAWLAAAQSSKPIAPAPVLDDGARRLFARLTLATRAWPRNRLANLASLGSVETVDSDLDALARAGLVETRLTAVAIAARATLLPRPVHDADDATAVATALAEVFPGDPHAMLRMAELRAEGGETNGSAVDDLALAALRSVVDADNREDFWARYDRILDARFAPLRDPEACFGVGSVVASEPGFPTPWVFAADLARAASRGVVDAFATLLAATEVAIKVGDVERGLGLAQSARGLALLLPADDERDIQSLLALGRVQLAAGDLTTSNVSMERALERAEQAGAAPGAQALRTRAAVELAEVRYSLGQLDEANRLCALSLGQDTPVVDASGIGAVRHSGVVTPGLRLAARNVVGKVLLARARFEDADRHFAADASDAACVGDTTSELRARLNRGIALMSQRRYGEARAMLEGVQRVGEARGETRAVCFALGNLAAIAILEHRYADALELLDRTIELLRRVGDKPRLAIFVTNLAELRLKLGLDREADQLLVFGRRVCGVSSPCLAQFSLVSARVSSSRKARLPRPSATSARRSAPSGLATLAALLRGDAGEGERPRGWAGSAGGLVTEALRVAARAALEEGDTDKALAFIDGADRESESARSRAEIAVLRAALSRALGDPFEDAAHEALRLARAVDEDDLTIEAHVLVYQSLVTSGRGGSTEAATHLARARALKSDIATTLPEWVRERYLARRDAVTLVRDASGRGSRDDDAPATTLRTGVVPVAPVGRARGDRAKHARRQPPELAGPCHGRYPQDGPLRRKRPHPRRERHGQGARRRRAP